MARQARTPVRLPLIAAPATPPAGFIDLYAKSDKHPYVKDDAGLETDLTAAGSPGGSSTARLFFLT